MTRTIIAALALAALAQPAPARVWPPDQPAPASFLDASRSRTVVGIDVEMTRKPTWRKPAPHQRRRR